MAGVALAALGVLAFLAATPVKASRSAGAGSNGAFDTEGPLGEEEAGEVWQAPDEDDGRGSQGQDGVFDDPEEENPWSDLLEATRVYGRLDSWWKEGSLSNSLSAQVLLKPHQSANLLVRGRLKDRCWPVRSDGKGDLEATGALLASYGRRIPAIGGRGAIAAGKDYFASVSTPGRIRQTGRFSMSVETYSGVRAKIDVTHRRYPNLPSRSWRTVAMNMAVARQVGKAGRMGMAYDLRQRTVDPRTMPEVTGKLQEYLDQAVRLSWTPDLAHGKQMIFRLRGDRRGDRYGRSSVWTRWEAAALGRHHNSEGYTFTWKYRLSGSPGGGAVFSGSSIEQALSGVAGIDRGASRFSFGGRISQKHFQEGGPRRSDYLTGGYTLTWEHHIGTHWTITAKFGMTSKYFPGNTARQSSHKDFLAGVCYSF